MKNITLKQIIIGAVAIAAVFFVLGIISTLITCGPDPVREEAETIRIDEDTVYTYAGDLDKDEEKALLNEFETLKEAHKILKKENYRLYGVVETTISYEGGEYESEGEIIDYVMTGYQPEPFGGFNWEADFRRKNLATFFHSFEASLYHTHYTNGEDLVVVAHLDSDEELLNLKSQDYQIDLKELYGKKWYQKIYLTGGAGGADSIRGRVGAGFDIGDDNVGITYDLDSNSKGYMAEYNWYPLK